MNLLLVMVAVFLVLVGNEYWWRNHSAHNELSRKFIHITVGSFVAFWPFFLSWTQIKFLSLAFILVVLFSKYLKIFQAIHSVQRPTWGELFFAASVGIIACLTQDPWIYAAALMQMSLADGLAAIVGVHYGFKSKFHYKVFGSPKSLAGSVAFFVTSFIILAVFKHFAEPSIPLAAIAGISLLATLIENIGVRGSDNLLVPLVVVLMLLQL